MVAFQASKHFEIKQGDHIMQRNSRDDTKQGPGKYVPPDIVIGPHPTPGSPGRSADIDITVSTYNHTLIDEDDAVRIEVSCSYDKDGYTHHKQLRFFLFVYGGVNEAMFSQRVESDWKNFTVYADGISYDGNVQSESSSSRATVTDRDDE